MRYSPNHKQETRAKVVKAAARAVRAKGPDGVAVAEIMAEAGLTHGGFYAHFPSKEALIAAAIEAAFGESRRRYDRLTEGLPREAALSAVVDAYVSQAHRTNAAGGCPIVALESDLPRQGPAVRDAFDAGVKALIDRIAAWLPDGVEGRDDLAGSLVAEMAGTVALARAVSDEDLAERLLAEGRRRIKARMGLAEQ